MGCNIYVYHVFITGIVTQKYELGAPKMLCRISNNKREIRSKTKDGIIHFPSLPLYQQFPK